MTRYAHHPPAIAEGHIIRQFNPDLYPYGMGKTCHVSAVTFHTCAVGGVREFISYLIKGEPLMTIETTYIGYVIV